jgi:hypothetical protein
MGLARSPAAAIWRARHRERQGAGHAKAVWGGLGIAAGYDETDKHKKIDTNFAALVNFQPTQHASARHPQKQGTNYYAGGTER